VTVVIRVLRRWLWSRRSTSVISGASPCLDEQPTPRTQTAVESEESLQVGPSCVGDFLPGGLQVLRTDDDELPNRIRLLEEEARASNLENEETGARLQALVGALTSRNGILEERIRLLQESIASLQAKNAVQREQLNGLKQRLETVKDRLRLASERVVDERSRRELLIARNSQVKEQLTATRALAAERREKLLQSLTVARQRLVTTSALWDGARRYFALLRQGLLYDEIEKSDVDLRADTYLCLLPSTVPAALALSRKYGGRVVCDCVENVEVHRHSLAPNLHPPALEMVNLTAYGALSTCDGLMTVSASVARTLERFGPPVRLQPNYRRFEVAARAGELRSRCGIETDATVLVTSGNVVEGFETVLDAIALLPQSVHLVALVRLSPSSYEAQVREHIAHLGLQERVHLVGFVPYDELAGMLADADLGLITLDPGNPNHSVSLPNRVFDFVTAGLPFVAPPLLEIEQFVREHRCGATITNVSAEAWASSINRVLKDLPAFRHAVVEARTKVTWESLEDGLIEFLGSPQTVTMLGFRDLTKYQRFLRIADSLSRRGIEVKAVFFSENPSPVEIPNAKFYHFADRYGLGPGLVEVAREHD